jgi:pimeloyl-ACP methyl ester carboxylesterase
LSYLHVDGDRRLDYEDHAGAGRPIVLIHGWGVGTRCWDTVLPALVEHGNRVVSLDLRCNGRSDMDFGDVTIATLGGDVVNLVNHLGLDGVVLNGWSAGGAVVVDAATRLGGALGGLVLTAAATPRYTVGDGWEWGDTPEGVAATIAAIRADRATALAGVAAAVCNVDVGESVVAWMHEMFLEAGPRGDDWLIDLAQVDQRAQLAEITAPAISLAGRHDVFVPYDGQAAGAAMLPNGRLVTFEDSGHAPFIEEGDKYRQELIGFLDEL